MRPVCCECNAPSPLPLLLLYIRRSVTIPQRCLACAITADRAMKPRPCMCEEFKRLEITEALPCVWCRRSLHPVCPCRDQPALLRIRCNLCDPSVRRRKFDRCQCESTKPTTRVYEAGWTDRFACVRCWVPYVFARPPWLYRLWKETGRITEVTREKFAIYPREDETGDDGTAGLLAEINRTPGLWATRAGETFWCEVL